MRSVASLEGRHGPWSHLAGPPRRGNNVIGCRLHRQQTTRRQHWMMAHWSQFSAGRWKQTVACKRPQVVGGEAVLTLKSALCLYDSLPASKSVGRSSQFEPLPALDVDLWQAAMQRELTFEPAPRTGTVGHTRCSASSSKAARRAHHDCRPGRLPAEVATGKSTAPHGYPTIDVSTARGHRSGYNVDPTLIGDFDEYPVSIGLHCGRDPSNGYSYHAAARLGADASTDGV